MAFKRMRFAGLRARARRFGRRIKKGYSSVRNEMRRRKAYADHMAYTRAELLDPNYRTKMRAKRLRSRNRRFYQKKPNLILIAVGLSAAYLFRSQIGDAFEKIKSKIKI